MKHKHVHCVGIGGIGVSALARYYQHEGAIVHGSDREESKLTEALQAEGMAVSIGEKAGQTPAATDLLVYSAAIPETDPERQQAKALNIPQKSYFAALGEISKQQQTISVCGTHGKSTTSAMLGLALEEVLDPLVILGTQVFEWGKKNVHFPKRGESAYAIFESCEYQRSFLNLHPKIIVITNIDLDHLDYFTDQADYDSAFRAFAEKLPVDGVLVADFSEERIRKLFDDLSIRKIDRSEYRDLVPSMHVFGAHNIDNAANVLAVCEALHIPKEPIVERMKAFRGTWRRFEYKGEQDEIKVYDDYAHHPKEIRAALCGFRTAFPDKKIWAVFQPHQYARTEYFLDDFAKSFSDADEVIIPNIYRVRDDAETHVTPELLVEKIHETGKKARFGDGFENTENILRSEVQPGDLVVTIGAGPVYKIGESFLGQ